MLQSGATQKRVPVRKPVSRTPALTPEQFTSFGELLKFLRRRAGLSQRELSIAVGYSESQISRLEQTGENAIHVEGVGRASPELLEFYCYDRNNNEVKFLPYDENRR